MPFDFDRSFDLPGAAPFRHGRLWWTPRRRRSYRDAFSPLFVGSRERGDRWQWRASRYIPHRGGDQRYTKRSFVQLVWRWRSPAGILDEGEAMLRACQRPTGRCSHRGGRAARRRDHPELTVQAGGYGMTNEQRIHVLSPELHPPFAPRAFYALRIPRGRSTAWMDAQQISYRSLADLSVPCRCGEPTLIIGGTASRRLPPPGPGALGLFRQGRSRPDHESKRPGSRLARPLHHPESSPPHALATPRPQVLFRGSSGAVQLAKLRRATSTSRGAADEPCAAILHRGHPVVAGFPRQLIATSATATAGWSTQAVPVPGGVPRPAAGVTPIAGVVRASQLPTFVAPRWAKDFTSSTSSKLTDNLGY